MTLQQARPLVARVAKTAELAETIDGFPLTALVAPAGYGKTCLLTLALAKLAKPNARYTAEVWQSDDFITPLVEEVRRIRPDFGRLTLALARRPARDDRSELTRWARRVGDTFAKELGHVCEPLVIAIEDVHVFARDTAFGEFLAGIVRALPDDVTLVLAGRTLPALPMAEWLADRRARLVGVEQLRFDAGDVDALAELLGYDVSAADATRLRETYEGWAAGLALAFMIGDRSVPSAQGSLTARSAYLLEANIATLDADLIAFLEATSVFATMDATVLESASDLGDVRRYLQELERHGIMLDVVRAGEAYRLHPLLREALEVRVRTRSGAEAVRRAHARAATLLARAGRTLEALFHFEAAEDDASLSVFVRDHAYELFVAGQGERIGRIARRIEREGGSPVVARLVEGMVLRQRGESGAEYAFARGIEDARRMGDVAAEVTLRLLITEDRLARREALDTAELGELAQLARLGSPLAEANATLFAGWSLAIEGDFVAARDRSRAALAIVRDDVIGTTRIASLDAYAATCLGDFESADARMLETLRSLESSDHVVLLVNTLVWYARLALLWGDAGAARDYAERGAALARELDLSAEIAGAEVALAEVFSVAGDRANCAHFCASARRSAASAWYSIDRDRTQGITAVFEARAAFAAGGAVEALGIVATAFGTNPPPPQRAALAGDAFAYLRLAGHTDKRFTSSAVAALLASAEPIDALDAVGIARSGDLFNLAKSAAEKPAVFHERSRKFEALIARRRERARSGAFAADPLARAFAPASAKIAETKRVTTASHLTNREMEILELLAQGLSNREIAQRFTLSPRTVDTHVERVLSKLDATSRTRAVAIAMRMGLVKPE